MQIQDQAPSRAKAIHKNGSNLHLLELPPSLESLTDVRSFVDTVELEAVLTPERIFDVKVALCEAAANAIEHAKARVNVALWVLNDRVMVDVDNIGEFGSNDEERNACRRVRGFGLKLMVSLADEVTFTGAKHGRTKVRLTFLRDGYQVPSVSG